MLTEGGGGSFVRKHLKMGICVGNTSRVASSKALMKMVNYPINGRRGFTAV